MRWADNTDTGPWRLAIDWFWLSHDEQSGKTLLSSLHAGLGQSAALLGELMISQHVTMQNDVLVATTREPPPDVLAHEVFSLVLGEPEPLPLRMWLSYLSSTARDDVGRYLQRVGLVWVKRSRLRRGVRWIPVDINTAGIPESRLNALLIDNRRWTVNDAMLAGLSEATGLLGGVLETSGNRNAVDSIHMVTERLHPLLRGLLKETRAAVGSAVLSERR